MTVCATVLVSCESTTTQELSVKVDNPTYSKDVAPVINASCVGCHSGGDQYPDLDSYNAVKDATANGSVLCKISGTCGIMPPDAPMPSQTVAMIKLWATNNCPN